MDRFEHALLAAAVAVSQALEPAVVGLRRLHSYLHAQMLFFGVPLAWHDRIIIAIWVVALFMLFRLLNGWLRLVMLVCTILMVAKMWGYLPG